MGACYVKKNDILETNDDILDPMEMYVTLDLDDGSTVECSIHSIFDVQDQDYIALLPLDENGEPNAAGEVYLYRYFEDEDGNPSLDNIKDDDEFDIVSDRFDEIQDEQEFEEM